MPEPLYISAKLNKDQCLGSALMLSFLTDLFSMSRKSSFEKENVLVILDVIGQRELPEGLMDEVKDGAEDNVPSLAPPPIDISASTYETIVRQPYDPGEKARAFQHGVDEAGRVYQKKIDRLEKEKRDVQIALEAEVTRGGLLSAGWKATIRQLEDLKRKASDETVDGPDPVL